MNLLSHATHVALILNTESGNVGGTESCALEFAQFLTRSGIRATIVQVGRAVLTDRAAALGIVIEFVPTASFSDTPLSVWRRVLRSLQPTTLVIAKNWHGTKSIALDLVAFEWGIPRVVWEHHPAPALRTSYWGRVATARWSKRCIRAWLHYRLADRVVAVSRTVQEPLVANYGLSRERVRVIYPGVDFERFQPDDASRTQMREHWGIHADQVVIGALGRLVPEKGYGRILELVADLRHQYGEQVVCVLGGDGPDRQRLEQLAQRLNVADITRFPGWIESAPGGWRAIDISLLPSENEGLGLARIEAAACGSIPIAADLEGMREVMAGELTRFRCPLDDPSSWRRLLSELVQQSSDERRQLSESVRRALRARFDANAQWQELLLALPVESAA